jgi:hypothetical protein
MGFSIELAALASSGAGGPSRRGWLLLYHVRSLSEADEDFVASGPQPQEKARTTADGRSGPDRLASLILHDIGDALTCKSIPQWRHATLLSFSLQNFVEFGLQAFSILSDKHISA